MYVNIIPHLFNKTVKNERSTMSAQNDINGVAY